MKPHLPLLLLTLFSVAFGVHAQDFKVIKETKDYILKECDSAYYYTHGLPPKDDFVIDTTKIHKVNGVLKLPLDNGKEVVFRDENTIYSYHGENKKQGYYLLDAMGLKHINFYYLIDKKNGMIDSLECNMPIFSPTIFYAYNIDCYKKIGANLFFKNIKSNKKICLNLAGGAPFGIKWIDDFSFELYTWNNTNYIYNYPKDKYYLVQIKQ